MTFVTLCKVWGVFALVSLLLYLFTGVSFWSPIPDYSFSFRGPLLFVFHLFGLIVGLVAYFFDVDD